MAKNNLAVLKGRTIKEVSGDHLGLQLRLDDGSVILICTSGQDRLEITRSAREQVSEEKMVTKDLV